MHKLCLVCFIWVVWLGLVVITPALVLGASEPSTPFAVAATSASPSDVEPSTSPLPIVKDSKISLSDIGVSSAPPPDANKSLAFQTVCAKLRAVKLVQADFIEDKTVRILSRPLHSTGILMFSPEQGVYRVMQTPMHEELLITRSQLVQKDAQGKVQRMGVRRQPAAQAFVDVFLSFFSGDERAWRKAFNVSFSGTENEWRIEFTPRPHTPVAKALRRIVLEGTEGILNAMRLTEADGDETHTVYKNQVLYHGLPGENAPTFPSDLKNS